MFSLNKYVVTGVNVSPSSVQAPMSIPFSMPDGAKK